MTLPEGSTWCATCGIYRTRFADRPCPCCAPDPEPAPVPPPRMYFDRPTPIATTSGEA